MPCFMAVAPFQKVIAVSACAASLRVNDLLASKALSRLAGWVGITRTNFMTVLPAQDSQPRGVIEVNKCLSIKGAEDRVNKPHAFEISTVEESMFFIADSDKVPLARRGWKIGHVGCGTLL